jgi:hypothetical protein
MAMFMAAEKFLAKYLDGRYQEGGTPEVARRLAEIMVDPKTVTLTKRVDAAAVGLPKPATGLKPGTYNYQAKIAMGAQEMALKLSTTIKEENGAWTATDTMETPMGAATDTSTLEKSSLVLRKRTVKQGPVGITVDFAGGKATGNMSTSGQDRPVSADLGGELFADGAGAPQAIGCLPLADGYTATFRNFDLQKHKAKLMQLKVVGTETVTVPAGKFETFKVDITSADGDNDQTTVWISKDSRQAVKVSSVMASMGGATMTAELMP